MNKILHYCPESRATEIDARYLPLAEEYRGVCSECNQPVYGNENGLEHE